MLELSSLKIDAEWFLLFFVGIILVVCCNCFCASAFCGWWSFVVVFFSGVLFVFFVMLWLCFGGVCGGVVCACLFFVVRVSCIWCFCFMKKQKDEIQKKKRLFFPDIEN